MRDALRRITSAIDPTERGRAALDAGRLDEAEAIFRSILAKNDRSAHAWWNLGLVQKQRRAWPEAATAFRRYIDLNPKAEEGYWNFGVAATGLKDWSAARWAWTMLNFNVEPGDGAPYAPLGPAPIRLNATREGEGEVVWAQRIDPCRAQLENVPLPGSGHRWHDIVFHDVAPRGSRTLRGQALGVFDEIERFEAAANPTLKAELRWDKPEDETGLTELLAERGLAGENWSSTVRFTCTRCSLAPAHAHEPADDSVRLVGTWGLAGSNDEVTRILDEWKAGGPRREATAPEVVA